MTSQAQVNANRRNSQKSTGPRTQEGKRAVSQNAVTHGLFAREAVIKCEDPAEFNNINFAKQSVRQGKLVRFSRFQSCPAKVSRPAGMSTCVS